MKRTNVNLRQAYYDILKDNIIVKGKPIPIYYLMVPKGFPDMYIVIQSINSVGRETKSSQDTSTSIQFVVYTRLERNSGWECDEIADKIYELCYPNREAVVPGCLSMDLVNDNTLGSLDDSGTKQVVERVITFNHIINN